MTKDEAYKHVREMMTQINGYQGMISTKPVITGWMSWDRMKALCILMDELMEEDNAVVNMRSPQWMLQQNALAQVAQQNAYRQQQAMGQGIVNSGLGGIGNILGTFGGSGTGGYK